MIGVRALTLVVILGSCVQSSVARSATDCAPGRTATVSGKIVSVVARESEWFIWLKRQATECTLAAVVVDGMVPAPTCKPGSHVMATGTIAAEDTLRSAPAAVRCSP